MKKICLILLFSIASSCITVAGNERQNLSQLVDSKGLATPLYRWNAQLVLPAGNPKLEDKTNADSPEIEKLTTWNFDKGKFDGITRFSPGIINPVMEDGKLKFTTGNKAFFYWGDHFNDPGVKGLDIGSTWPLNSQMIFRHGWEVEARVKQLLPQSKWTVLANQAGMPPYMDKKTILVKGTGWQIIRFLLPMDRRNKGVRRNSLCFDISGKGNKIEIDWVKVVRPVWRQYFRKEFIIDKPVKSAELCFIPTCDYKLYINGKKIASGLAKTNYETVNITGCLRPGKNVIAFSDWTGINLIRQRIDPLCSTGIEVYIQYKDGSFRRIYTNKSWKGSFHCYSGWNKLNFNDRNWKNVVTLGNVAESLFTIRRNGKSIYGRAFFLDPPYYGPIKLTYPGKDISADSPVIFRENEGANIRMELAGDKNYSLNYKLFDALTDKQIDQGVLTGKNNTYHFSVKRKAGVYNLAIEASVNGKLLDRRFEEIVIVGPVPQRKVPWRKVSEETIKQLIAEFACGGKPRPGAYIEHPRVFNRDPAIKKLQGPVTEIEIKDGKKYRLTGKGYADWFGYRFKVKNIHNPHMLVVEYPDDRPQSFAVRVKEKDRAYFKPVANDGLSRASIWCLNDPAIYPLSNKIQSASFIYYPQAETEAVEVLNLQHGGVRSAVYKIKIYEILDMPCPENNGKGNRRLFGSQTERATLRQVTYFNGKDSQMFSYLHGPSRNRYYGFLRDWYITYSNMIKRMRFAGENMFMCGFYMYHAPYWPNSKMGYRFSTANYDNFALMFAMFEENGMYVLPFVEYCRSVKTRAMNKYTNKEVKEGAPTILAVNKYGEQALYNPGMNNFNPFSKTVRDELEGIAGEIASRYGKYKSFAGIGYFSGGLCEPSLHIGKYATQWKEALHYGWEDSTVKAFEKIYDIRIPVKNNDPERFLKRYKWVMRNAKDKWIEFRCRAMTEVHKGIRDAIVKIAPHAEYYPFFVSGGKPELLAEAVICENVNLLKSLKYMGFDPAMYRDQENIDPAWFYYPESFGKVHNVKDGLLMTFNNLKSFNKAMNFGERSACFINPAWQEPDIRNTIYRNWVWHGGSQVNPNPFFCGVYYRAPFVDRLRQMTPSFLGFVFTDNHLYTAQNHLRRPFAVAYKSIPEGNYRTLDYAGTNKNIVIREILSSGKRIFYVVNPLWWKAKAKITLSADAKLSDLVEKSSCNTAGKILNLKMPPYSVKVFSIPENVKIVSAETKVEDKCKVWLKKKMDVINSFGAKETEQAFKAFSLPEPLKTSMARVRLLKSSWQNKDYVRAYDLLCNPLIIQFLDFIKAKKAASAKAGVKIRDNYLVNIGADKPYKDSQGRTWQPDQFYNFGINPHGYIGDKGAVVHRGNIAVSNTKDPEIYRTERSKFKGYRFRVPNGVYTVKIHFAENFRYIPGRLSDVYVEGNLILKDYDFCMASKGFHRAYIHEIKDVKVKDGELAIDFKPLHMTRMQGLEVEKQK